MALISNSATAEITGGAAWRIPSGNRIDRTNIPRGMVTFNGSQQILALGAGDTLRIRTIFNLPSNFIYQIKTFAYQFNSDDVTISMENSGFISYSFSDGSFLAVNLTSPGIHYLYETAQGATKLYDPPVDFAKPFMNGAAGDFFTVGLTDLTPTSVAGDVIWNIQLYQYDIEQIQNWQLNVSTQVIS